MMNPPKILNRISLRLPHYDYNQNGFYFVTICTESNGNLLGYIHNGNMVLSPSGQMTELSLLELPNRFKGVKILKLAIMPNHIHFILSFEPEILDHQDVYQLSKVIQWFKSSTTVTYIQGVKSGIYPPFDKRIWQRNYYEHVIRSEEDYQRIWTYIDENVLKWHLDEYYIHKSAKD